MRQNPAFDTAKKGSKSEEEHSANLQTSAKQLPKKIDTLGGEKES